MMPLTDVERRVCDRIAQRMGGRFVLNEDRPMTDKPEAVRRWPFNITGYAPSHRQLRLPDSLTPEQITAATGVEPIQRPDGDKVTLQWTFWAEWTYSVPGATDGGFATHCKIWDYDGARWSAFGPPEVFRQIGLEPSLTTDYGTWHYDEDGNRLVEYVDAAIRAKHSPSQPDASALVEAVRGAAKNAEVQRVGVLLHATDWLAVMDALAAIGKAD